MPNRPVVNIVQSGRAFYSPSKDSVTVPELSQYAKPEEYYSTLFHELAHSTGHESRLNREGVTGCHHFGSATYCPYKPVIRHANKPNFEHDGFSLDMPCLYRGEIRKNYRGDIINRIVYPWSNLLELVRLTPGKKIHFQFTTEAGPSKILGEDENSFYVLMPMKVSDDIEQEDEIETEAAA